MKTLLFLAMSLMMANAAMASEDQSDQVSSITRAPTDLATTITLWGDDCSSGCKAVLAAQDDLKYFIATQGQARSARADQALKITRMTFQQLNQAEDMALAQLLLESMH